MLAGPITQDFRFGRPIGRPFYGRPFGYGRHYWGAPFVSGLLGGVIGSALFNPYLYGGYPFGFYGSPFFGAPFYGGYWF